MNSNVAQRQRKEARVLRMEQSTKYLFSTLQDYRLPLHLQGLACNEIWESGGNTHGQIIVATSKMRAAAYCVIAALEISRNKEDAATDIHEATTHMPTLFSSRPEMSRKAVMLQYLPSKTRAALYSATAVLKISRNKEDAVTDVHEATTHLPILLSSRPEMSLKAAMLPTVLLKSACSTKDKCATLRPSRHACQEKADTANDAPTGKPRTSCRKSRFADVDPRTHLTTESSKHFMEPLPPPRPHKQPSNAARLLERRHQKQTCCADITHEASFCADTTHEASRCAHTTHEAITNVCRPRPPSEARRSIRPQRKICGINAQRRGWGTLKDTLVINQADMEATSAVFHHTHGGAQCSGTDGMLLAGAHLLSSTRQMPQMIRLV